MIDQERPIRVVLFSGAFWDATNMEFACMLDEHEDIELLGVYCQGIEPSFGSRIRDLWARRGILAFPILLLTTAKLFRWKDQRALRRRFASLRRKVRFVPNIHAENVLQDIRRVVPDLGLIYGGPILRAELLSIPRLGTLGIHHGKLPDYRGVKTTFWAMFNGEESAAVTIQRANAGIDTGELVRQAEVSVARKSLRKVERELNRRGLEIYLEAVLAVRRGTAQLVPQDRKGKLYRNPTAKDHLVFCWRQLKRRWR